MAGLAPTNAEEIPVDGNNFNQSPQPPQQASVKQLDYIFSLAQDLYGDAAYRRIGLHISINLGKDSGKDLTRQEASEIIERLLNGEDLSLPEDD